jgi:hypothetical protein
MAKNLLTPQMINTLRKEYGKINFVDPELPAYQKLTSFLDKMTQDQLKQLADAKIKFVSVLARNRIK